MVVQRQVQIRLGADAEADVPALPALPAPPALSAVCQDGCVLWLAGDEKPLLHRLSLTSDGAFGDPLTFWLGDLVKLPEGRRKEVDVEGMDRAGEHLWLVGSHSWTRKSVAPEDDDRDVPELLAEVRPRPSRDVLIRLPIAGDGDDVHPVGSTDPAAGPRGALLDGDLRKALTHDDHLEPFLEIPSKDGGLDIEGLVAVDDALLLGLRGPVLRGWAVALEVQVVDHPDHPGRLVLDGEEPGYRKIFLDLDGLGVRDLCRVGDDVLVLAGPTMQLDGPVRLYRWTGGAAAGRPGVVRGRARHRVATLPFGRGRDEGRDHAEGVTPLSSGDPTELLVVYDSPAESRRVPRGGVLADVVRL